ncbi:N-acetyllactosaminide beta-1,6-N-acetylglucosaminyl-transferase-like [Lytechinus pictus]|uniref:N-acetyllactosaminide beta-1,6-N-acetylglucosaminyl-transferase-like n=1 Tax=Lytechinus pictus TaxID=7653 RepID=UPI0030B9E685
MLNITYYRRRLRLWPVLTCMFLVGFTIAFVTRSRVEPDTVNELTISLDIRAKSQASHPDVHNFHGSIEEKLKYLRLKSIFLAGEWKSDLLSSYHKPYPANCSAILSGDKLAIAEGTLVIRDRRSIQMPGNEEVNGWTSDCKGYKNRRKYPTKSYSDEEQNFPIAYIISVIKHGAQIERLFRAIYAPQNFYCFHIDRKAPRHLHVTIKNLTNCFNNAFIASKSEYIRYSRLKADMSCMSDLMSHEWKYVINLENYDFPLKTNLEIVRQLKALDGRNDIPGVHPEQSDSFVGRTLYHHEAIAGRLRKTPKKKDPPPHSALIYLGTPYFAASRKFVAYVRTNQTAMDLLDYLSDSSSPSRYYWVTVNRYPGVPGGFPNSTWATSLRLINFTNTTHPAPCIGQWVDNTCIIGPGYVPYLSTMPYLFVNGVYYDINPVPLQCLEELLDYRTKNPESIYDFVPDFPATKLFDVSSNRKPPDHPKPLK